VAFQFLGSRETRERDFNAAHTTRCFPAITAFARSDTALLRLFRRGSSAPTYRHIYALLRQRIARDHQSHYAEWQNSPVVEHCS
jgi:hypothetical protein